MSDSESKTGTETAVHDVVHTQGPWKVPKRFDIYQDLGPTVGGTYIGTTSGNRVLAESVAKVDEANARLMAKSPEMLEMVRESNLLTNPLVIMSGRELQRLRVRAQKLMRDLGV